MGSAKLRVLPDSLGWGLAVTAHVLYERRVRNDLEVSLGSRVAGLTTGLAVEAGRAVSPRLYLTGTVGVSVYSASSAFPAPNVLGSIYRTFAVPELDVAARRARPYLGGLGARLRASGSTFLWVSVQAERLEPVGAAGPTGLGPDGARTVVSTVVGVTLR